MKLKLRLKEAIILTRKRTYEQNKLEYMRNYARMRKEANNTEHHGTQ
jgi:hypothetical protein